jgi:hypothetical protein
MWCTRLWVPCETADEDVGHRSYAIAAVQQVLQEVAVQAHVFVWAACTTCLGSLPHSGMRRGLEGSLARDRR